MRASEYSAHASRQIFWGAFALTLVIKLALAAGFPITGDEAFFYQWGVFPAWGYSDHPPMVGWLLAGLRMAGEHPLVLRSATLLAAQTDFIHAGDLKVFIDEGQLAALDMLDSFGQRSVLRFGAIDVSGRVPADRFRFTPPAGVDVLRQ